MPCAVSSPTVDACGLVHPAPANGETPDPYQQVLSSHAAAQGGRAVTAEAARPPAQPPTGTGGGRGASESSDEPARRAGVRCGWQTHRPPPSPSAARRHAGRGVCRSRGICRSGGGRDPRTTRRFPFGRRPSAATPASGRIWPAASESADRTNRAGVPTEPLRTYLETCSNNVACAFPSQSKSAGSNPSSGRVASLGAGRTISSMRAITRVSSSGA